jgi:hypothetical protein
MTMSKSPTAKTPTTGNNKPQDAEATIVSIAELALAFRGDKPSLATIARLTNRASWMLRLDANARAAAENGATIEVAKRLGLIS